MWLIIFLVILIGSGASTYMSLEDAREDCEDRGGEFSWYVSIEIYGYIEGESFCVFPEDSDIPDERRYWVWGTPPPPTEAKDPLEVEK